VNGSASRRVQGSLAAGAVALALVTVQAAQPPQPAQPQVPFRAGVEVVSLNVTVTDGTTRYVTDLTADDFNVFEDGVKQEVTFFNRTNLPIALALLLDTSASMEAKLPTAQEAAIGFAKRLRPDKSDEFVPSLCKADANDHRGHERREYLGPLTEAV